MSDRGIQLLRKGAFVTALALALASCPLDAAGAPDFERDIRPLLSERCYACHGERKQESGLRLDRREAALAGGDHGPLLQPGQPEASALIQVVSGRHAEVARMPGKGDPLTDDEIGRLRDWIQSGAAWPADAAVAAAGPDPRAHWAFQPVRRPAVPMLSPDRTEFTLRNPIDHFVLATLKDRGMSSSPEADRITFLRRVSLDLTGLPPSEEDADTFLADTDPDAPQRVVERLLASPHYGEKWARHWLDAARYADSNGFEKDRTRTIWPWRDWVIRAFNADQPFDEFTRDQLAGDLLPEPTLDQRIATGFLRNSMINMEGGIEPEKFRVESIVDRVDAVGRTWLGLTIACAQCHNHKYDPISQEEYYRLFAFLNNDHESSRVYYTPDQQMRVNDLTRRIRDLEEGLRHATSDWEPRMAAWEDSVAAPATEWQVVECRHTGDNGERFYHYADGSIRAASYAPTYWTAHFRATNHLASIGAFRLEQLPDPNLPSGGPGRSIKGMSALSEFRVEAEDPSNPTNKVKVKFVRATADFENPEKPLEPEFQSESRNHKDGDKRTYGPVAHAIDGNADTAWGIDAGPGRRNVARQAVFVPETPVTFANAAGIVLEFLLDQKHGGDNSDDNQNHNLGRFRLSVTSSTNAVADPVPASVRQILGIPRAQRSPHQVAAV
ncbi:MAG: DUF1549 domain-containing protein, partial [Verrucomicrobiae bacterium]|nr:DUF1549 domain-containing protein [Verrucomicrobiae bacterium]